MLQSRMHADFADAGSDSGHGFPVKWIQALLDPSELEPGQSSGIPWERAHIAPG
jgi:hypothetical protein